MTSEAQERWSSRLSPETLARRSAELLATGALQGERAILVHDLDRMTARVRGLQTEFPSNALHGIAVKANPVLEILRLLVETGAGLECASLEEVELSLAAGCAPARIIFDSPAKTREEIAFALARGIHLNLDNFEELRRVAELAGAGVPGHVGLRINPQVGSGSISMTSVAGRVSKFGIPLEARHGELLDAYARYPWLDGLHVHVGSQGCEMGQLVLAVARLLSFRDEAMARRDEPISQLDIGGGLSVAYQESDQPPELASYVAALRQEAPGAFAPGTRLLTEFGRSIHAGCGWALSRVEYTKHEADQHMAVLHLGADAFMRRVYRPDEWHHDFLVLNPDGSLKQGTETRPVTLVGPLCFGGDVLARDVELPVIGPTDLVIVRDCGAYTLSMWSRHCSRGLPKVLGWRSSGVELLKRREEPSDVVEFWSR